MGLQRVGHNWATYTLHSFECIYSWMFSFIFQNLETIDVMYNLIHTPFFFSPCQILRIFKDKFLKISPNLTPFSDLHYLKKLKKARLQLSSEQNSPLSLHFTQIKSQEFRGSQRVCHNLGWSRHPPQNCGLEHFSLWYSHSLHFYFLHVFSLMPPNLRGLNWPAILFHLLAYFYYISRLSFTRI